MTDENTYERDSGQWFFVTDDGVGFFAVDAPESQFYRGNLPNRLVTRYFLGWLFALNQRFVLSGLSEEILDHWRDPSLDERVAYFRELRRVLLDFSVHDRNLRLTHRARQHRFYRTCCNVLEVEQLYRDVKERAKELYDDLLLDQERSAEERSRRFEQRLSVLAALFGVPAIVVGFLGINLSGVTSEFGLQVWAAAVLFLVGWMVGAALLYFALARRRMDS